MINGPILYKIEVRLLKYITKDSRLTMIGLKQGADDGGIIAWHIIYIHNHVHIKISGYVIKYADDDL